MPQGQRRTHPSSGSRLEAVEFEDSEVVIGPLDTTAQCSR